MSFLGELKRRNVIRVAVAYVLLVWATLQGADFLLDLVGAPDWVIRAFAVAGLLGFPLVLVFSWAYELTPEGLRRERDSGDGRASAAHTARRLDWLIVTLIVLTLAIVVGGRFIGPPRMTQTPGEHVTHGQGPAQTAPPGDTLPGPAQGRRSIAVLPFLALSGGPDDGYFADGLTEEILNALAQLPELLVTARTSAFQFRHRDVAVQEVAARLGVDHVVEGSVRRAGERLRVTAQLVRAGDGFHLWSNNYDAASADVIAVQEDIAEHIALALDVVLDDTSRAAMQRAGLRNVEAFIAFQRGQELYERAHGSATMVPDLLRQANEYLDEALRLAPGYPPALRMRGDRAVHLLLDDADLTASVPLTEQQREDALKSVRSNLERAIRSARSDEERDNLALDLAFLTGHWQGMPDRIERELRQTGCDSSDWSHTLAMAFGHATQVVRRWEILVACDPLIFHAWNALMQAQAWAGDADGILETGRSALRTLDEDFLVVNMATGHLMKGDVEEAERLAATHLKSSVNLGGLQVLLAAVRGDAEGAVEWIEDYRATPGFHGWRLLDFHAWFGRRDEANRLAAAFDRHPQGSMALMLAVDFCLCGAPWDLEATPSFRGKLREAGMNWPPDAPIRFPLKDW